MSKAPQPTAEEPSEADLDMSRKVHRQEVFRFPHHGAEMIAAYRAKCVAEATESARLELCKIGLSPSHYNTLDKAIVAACRTVNFLRENLAEPAPDIQEKVIKMLNLVSAEALDELKAEKRLDELTISNLREALSVRDAEIAILKENFEVASRHWENAKSNYELKLSQVIPAFEELDGEKEARDALIVQMREFLEKVSIAEDRSNLDGDCAEVVLEQLNSEAERMLALVPESLAGKVLVSAIDAAQIDDNARLERDNATLRAVLSLAKAKISELEKAK